MASNRARHEGLEQLLPPKWRDRVQEWVAEDAPKWDVGGYVVGDAVGRAALHAKSAGRLAGRPFADYVFELLGCSAEWHYPEGYDVTEAEACAKLIVATVSGPVHKLLLAERTALNILSRASGVATAARDASALVKARGWHGRVAGTRKTTPGFGIVEKYALLVGDADTHRMDLSAMVMLKDNHIWSTGSIKGSVERARFACGFATKIEVECTSEADAREAIAAGADIVMLDNFEPAELHEVAARLKAKWPHLLVEASGGITAATIQSFLSPHVDIISQGALTNGYATLDFSLKVPKPEVFAKRQRVEKSS